MQHSTSPSTSMGAGREEAPSVGEGRQELAKGRSWVLQPLVHVASRLFDRRARLASRLPRQDLRIPGLRLARTLALFLRSCKLLGKHACDCNHDTAYQYSASETYRSGLEVRQESPSLSVDR